MGRRAFGSIRQLPSKNGKGRFQVRYRGPDGKQYTARTDDGRSLTFTSKSLADDYLARISADIQRGTWTAPGSARTAARPVTLSEYADAWLAGRNGSLRPSTREHYRRVLDALVLNPQYGDLGSVPVGEVDQDTVERWWAKLPNDRPTYVAHAYQVLRTILRSAKRKRLISEVPTIDGAGRSERKRQIRILSPAELDALVAAMPERYRLMVKLSAWCGLRYGEATALTAADVDVKRGVLHVRRGVTRTKGQWHLSTPKNGRERTVAIPGNIIDALAEHVDGLAPDALLFPAPRGGYMIAPTFGKVFRTAAASIGRPDVRVHDLRHFGLTRYAMAGASLAEIMDRGGHRTVSAAQVYFNIAHGRDAEITARMAEMAAAGLDTTQAPS